MILAPARGALGQASGSASLNWARSADPYVVNYKVYFGAASLTYTNYQSVGNVTNATVTGLLPGTTYYFTATAVDSFGTESDFSNELTCTIPGGGSSPPTISTIPTQAVEENGTVGPLPFTVGDAQTPASNLLVSATSSNPTLVPTGSILLGGTGPTRTVTVATALGQTGTTLITLSVSDGSGSANTSFMLTVSPLPSITLTAPVGGSVYSAPASISLAAMVSSNGQAISEVEFYDGATLLAVDAAPPYSCVWTNVGAGQYNLSAWVVDQVGNAVHSAAAQVTVTNVTPMAPIVTLTSPTYEGIFPAPATLEFSAAVITNGHVIKMVEFYNGANRLASILTPPYTFIWSNALPGTCQLWACAVYDSGLLAFSATNPISIVGLSAPWIAADIGAEETAGAAGETNGFYLISGAGAIGGNTDGFRFVYQPLIGDGTLLAQINSVQNTGSNSFAGLMVRQSLDSGSAYAMLGLTADGRILWSSRTIAGGLAASTNAIEATASATWVYISRVNDTFSGAYSTNGIYGTNWIQVDASALNLTANALVGFAVSSGVSNVLNTSTFTNVFFFP